MYNIFFKRKGPIDLKIHWAIWQLLINLKQFEMALNYRLRFFNNRYLKE